MKKQIVLIIGVLLLSSALLGIVNGAMPAENANSISSGSLSEAKNVEHNGASGDGAAGHATSNETGAPDSTVPPLHNHIPSVRIHGQPESVGDLMVNKAPRTFKNDSNQVSNDISPSLPIHIAPITSPKTGMINKPNVWLPSTPNSVRAISGHITTNTTWNGGTIYVNGNLIIDSGVTLTIYSGTTVMISKNAAIYVDGTLHANGTPLEPVVFTNASASAPGFWGGIIVNTSATNVVLELVNVSYAYYGVFVNNTLANISYSTFWQDIFGVYVTHTAKDVDDSINMTIFDNVVSYSHVGIYVDLESSSTTATTSLHGEINVTTNHVAHVDYVGIFVYASAGGTLPTTGDFNITFYNNNVSYVYGTVYSAAMEAVIVANSNGAVNMHFLAEDNEFYGDALSILVHISAAGTPSAYANAVLNVVNNSIVGIASGNPWGIELDVTPDTGGIVNVAYNVKGNTLEDNTMGISSFLYTTGIASGYARASVLANISENVVNDSLYGMYLSTISNSSAGVSDLNATYNVKNNTVNRASRIGMMYYVNATISGASNAYTSVFVNTSGNLVNHSVIGMIVESNAYEYAGSGTPQSIVKVALSNDSIINSGNYGVILGAFTEMQTHVGISNITGYLTDSNISTNYYGVYAVSFDYGVAYKTAYTNISVVNNIITNNEAQGILSNNAHLEIVDNYMSRNANTFGYVAHQLMYEDFSGTWPPPGWSTEYYPSVGTAHNGTWELSNTNNAGGSSPEAVFFYASATSNSISEDDWLITSAIDTSGYTLGELTFKTAVDNFLGNYVLSVKTYNGAEWSTVWQVKPTGNIGPETVTIPLSSSTGIGSRDFRVAFVFSGNPWNINYWYIDDVSLSVDIPDTWAVQMIDGSKAVMENNVITNNVGGGVYTDSSSILNWIVTAHADVENNGIIMNGNLSVAAGASMNLYNVTASMWDVNVAGDMSVDNAPHTIITNNVTVGGTLYLNGTTWEIAGTFDNEHHIEVMPGGQMVIQNLGATPSRVTSASYASYQFWVDNGATFEVYNSEIHHVGWAQTGDDFMHMGLWIATDTATLVNATLTDNHFGLIIYKSAPSIKESNVSQNTVVGIWAQSSSADILNNTISNNGIDNVVMNGTSDNLVGNYIGNAGKYGVVVINALTAVLQSNTVVGSGDSGIIMGHGTVDTHVMVADNNVTQNYIVGIYKMGDGVYVIESNNVTNNQYGIWVQSANQLSAGIAYRGAYRLIYLPFGFEQINGQNIRNGFMDKVMPWFGNPAHVLLVNGAGDSHIAAYYNNSLTAIGYGPSKRYYWDVAAQGTPPASVLENNGTVIWFTGHNDLSAGDRASIETFLKHGGNLMFSSPYSGYNAMKYGWYTWYKQWFRADYVGFTMEHNIVGHSLFGGMHMDINPYSGDGEQYSYAGAVKPYNGSYSVLEYQEVEVSSVKSNYVASNSELGVFENYTAPIVSDNTIVSNENGLMWSEVNTLPAIVNNNVSGNTGFGVMIEGNTVNFDAQLSYGNTMMYNGGDALAVYGTDVTLNLTGNRNIISHNYGNNLYIDADNTAQVKINNDMDYAGQNGAYINADMLNMSVWNCTISHSGQNALFAEAYGLTSNITRLVAEQNDYSGLYLDAANDLFVNMSSNVITNAGKTGVYLYSGMDLMLNQNNDSVVSNGASGTYSDEEIYAENMVNVVVSNSNMSLASYRGISINSNGVASVTIDNNVFYGNSNEGLRLFAMNVMQLISKDNVVSTNGNAGMYAMSHAYITGNETGDNIIGNVGNGAEIYNTRVFAVSHSNFNMNTENGFYLSNGNLTTFEYCMFNSIEHPYIQARGLYVGYGSNISVSHSTFEDDENGIYAEYSHDIKVTSSTFRGNEKYGIDIYSSDGVDILSNTFDDMGTSAIYISEVHNLTIGYNTLTSNHNGVELINVQGAGISNNTIVYSDNYGVDLQTSSGVDMNSNVIQHNYLGVYSSQSTFIFGNNTLTYNLGSANRAYTGGLWMENSKATLYNNVISYNIGYGIYSDANSIVNWFVTSVAKVHSNPVYMAGNITVESGATMNIMGLSGAFPDGTPIGLYIQSSRINQYGIFVESSAKLVVENSYISSISENAYKFDVYGSMIMDGSTVEYAYVLSVHSSAVLIKGSTITHGWLGGIAVYNSTPVIENTNIAGNTYYGLMLYNSGATIGSDVIRNNRIGVLLNKSQDVNFEHIRIYQNNIGIKAIGGSAFTLLNSSLASVENDMYLEENSHGFILNSHFDEYSVITMDSSSISVNWFLNITALDRQNNPVYGAEVSVYDVKNHTITTGTTNAVGTLSWVIVPEYVQTQSGKEYYTPTMIKLTWKSQTFSKAILVSKSMNSTIVIGNQDPVITSDPVRQVKQGQEYRYAVVANDPDGDALTYTLVSAPSGMTIDSTGVITWTPGNADVGVHYIIVKVSDGHGGYAEQVFNLTVTNVNDPPIITSDPVRQAKQGQEYRYAVVANDPDGDALTYTLVGAPSGMTIDSTGVITWTPGIGQAGEYNVTVMVSDGHGGYANQSFTISVIAVNHVPEILNVSVSPVGGDSDSTYIFTLTYMDPDGDNASAVFLILDGKQYEMQKVSGKAPTQGVVYVVKEKLTPGAHAYSFEVVDSKGASNSSSGYTMYVNMPPDHMWDYLLVALFIAVIALIVVDIYLWRYRRQSQSMPANVPEEQKEPVTLESNSELNDEEL